MLDLEPVKLHSVEVETETIGFIEIRTTSGAHLVTVIELLSPTNKKESGRDEYVAKMDHLRKTGVNLVEIDLLLGGERLEMQEPLPAGDFYAFVKRQEQYPLCDVFAWSIRRKLPKVPIPLHPPDADVVLDLAEAFETTFKRGGYGSDLVYDRLFPPTLSEADRVWIASIVGVSAG